ncbi:MAG: MFS transporter, partial [Caldilineae bacterium]
ELLREDRDFRYLWYGQIVSLLGDWFNLIGSATLIATLTQSGFAVGGLFVVRMLAPFLVSPLAGVVADRYERRTILIIADILRALVVLGFLLVRDPSTVWLLYALTALQLALSGFFDPARNALLPDIVQRRHLGAANALTSATWSIMLAVGAALGGLVAGYWGVYTSFVIDALTFLLSAWLLMQIGHRSAPGSLSKDHTVGGVIKDYVDGWRYLNRERRILFIALQKGLLSLVVAGGFQVVQVAISKQVFVIGEGGSLGLGIFMMIFGVGTGLGPIFVRRLSGDADRSLQVGILFNYLIATLGLLLIAPLANFAAVNAGMFLRGWGGGVLWVFTTQLLLQNLPEGVRGRVFATEYAFFTLCSAAGAAWTGLALDRLGIGGTLWLMTGLGLLPALLWAWLAVLRQPAVRPAEEPLGD